MSAAALAGLAVAVSWLLADSLRWGIPPMPTSRAVRAASLELMRHLPAVQVAELGAGCGGMARRIATELQTRVWAVEGSGWAYALARLGSLVHRAWHGRADGVIWQRGDFMACCLCSCQGVFCYLYRGAMPKLSAKLKAELPPEAWVVSVAFALPDWQPERVVWARDALRTPVYLYRQS